MEAMVKARFKRVRYWGYEWFSATAEEVLPAVRLAARVFAATLTETVIAIGTVGRPPAFTDARAAQLQKLLNQGKSVTAAVKKMKLSRSGIYKNFDITKTKRGKYLVARKKR
jgi:hypothetical protein